MKLYYSFLISIILFSCTQNKKSSTPKKEINIERQIVKQEFQSIIDSSRLIGSILIYDSQKNIYYSNSFKWSNQGQLPASTFKIPNSIIALETGVVENDSTLFKWNGEKRWLKKWEQDLIFKDAFHFSCVPCYQEIARKIGEKRMKEYLSKLDYGNIILDSTTIDVFWLEGDSHISQFQQIDFIKRFYESKLPISERTEKIMKRLMVIEKNDNYSISGKTGWSTNNDKNNGWFVGLVERDNQVYYFATNVEPQKQFNMDQFSVIRTKITYSALKKLGIINKTTP